jgi:hypothetical protein
MSSSNETKAVVNVHAVKKTETEVAADKAYYAAKRIRKGKTAKKRAGSGRGRTA